MISSWKKILPSALLLGSIMLISVWLPNMGWAGDAEKIEVSLSTWMDGRDFPQGCPVWFGGVLKIEDNLHIYKSHRDRERNLKINKRLGKAASDATVGPPPYRDVTIKRSEGQLPWSITVTRDGKVIGDDWEWVAQPLHSTFPEQVEIRFIAFPKNQRVSDRLPVGTYEIAVSAEILAKSDEIELIFNVTAKPLRFAVYGENSEYGEGHILLTRAHSWKNFLDITTPHNYPERSEVEAKVQQLPMYRFLIFREKERRRLHFHEEGSGGPGNRIR